MSKPTWGDVIGGVVGGFAALGIVAAWVMFSDWLAERRAHA